MKVGFDLYQHNQIAYDSALLMLQEEGRVAVVHPTGTGKSFLGLQLCAQHPQSKVCWLSPSEYIFQTQLENWVDAGGERPQNLSFYTYAKLMLMSMEEISAIQADYLVLDEFHRCGAEMWGQGVERLLRCHASAKVLGLSATNVRYLDSQRDMAEELFDGNIASEMTLGEAIVRGILQPPKYVLAVYSYQKELEDYEGKIARLKSPLARKQSKDYLESLRRALERSEGLDTVFKKHMKPDGKYILFCSNVDHLERMVNCVPRWFTDIDTQPHIYKAHASLNETAVAFDAFKADDSPHLKLLFCIDMLNEGVHVDDVDGVVLFRPTVSPIIYKQQIGRALSAGTAREPVIFDVVNNLKNLYSIGTIQDEMDIAIQYYRDHGEGDKIINETFAFYDEVGDSRALFDQLEESLSASWEMMYGLAKAYYQEHGNLEMTKHYRTEEGYSLGRWVATQRRVRSGKVYGTLGVERVRLLDEIGMVWDSLRDLYWTKNYEAAKEFYNTHGHLTVPTHYETTDGLRLGGWISQLRVYRKNEIQQNYLTPERVAMMDQLGMVWSVPDYLWEQNFYEAMDFYKEHGHLDVPAKFVSTNGIRLGTWIRTLRTKKMKDALTEAQVLRLHSIGMIWGDAFSRKWEQGFQEAELYHKAHGNLDVPTMYTTPSGFKLGKWVANHRNGTIRMAVQRKERLDSLGMIWAKPDPWEERFALLEAYYQAHGNLNMPGDYVTDGVWLAKWLNEQKQIYWGKRKGKTLTQEQIARLEAISVSWKSSNELLWDERYAEAVKRIAQGDTLLLDPILNRWYQSQIRYLQAGKLSEEQGEKLQALSVETDVSPWENGLRHAKEYRQEHGDLNVPSDYICSDGYKLGTWFRNQKSKYNGINPYNPLSATQIAELEALGILWSHADGQWEERFQKASRYVQQHGNLHIGTKYKDEDGYRLGDWMRQQVEKYRAGKLSQEQIDKLESIGMDWMFPLEREWEHHFSSAKEYYQRYGNLQVSTSYKDAGGFALGLWLWRIRQGKTKLTTNGGNGNQLERLQGIGFRLESERAAKKPVGYLEGYSFEVGV